MSHMRIAFTNTFRIRPIVLTSHEVDALSRDIGRDVTAELAGMASAPFEVYTLGALMRALAVALRQREHAASAACWCGPTVEHVDPDTGIAVYVHKELQ